MRNGIDSMYMRIVRNKNSFPPLYSFYVGKELIGRARKVSRDSINKTWRFYVGNQGMRSTTWDNVYLAVLEEAMWILETRRNKHVHTS